MSNVVTSRQISYERIRIIENAGWLFISDELPLAFDQVLTKNAAKEEKMRIIVINMVLLR